MDAPKRALLLPPPPQVKKEAKTYCFELTLGESNDKTYPEFSWKDLVREARNKEAAQKAEKGGSSLNPYASDDEDELKAMAARFEEKYNNTSGSGKLGKRKRRVQDYIDLGAGYDLEDPFIDNNDIYDEVVPEDLETVHGGFYINSGSLDYKEVEVSDCDVDEEIEENHKKCKTPPHITKSTKPCLPKAKKQPAGIVKRRGSSTNSIKEKKTTEKDPRVNKPGLKEGTSTTSKNSRIASNTQKKNPAMVILSSSSESSTSSSDDSSSSDSESEVESKKIATSVNSSNSNAKLSTETLNSSLAVGSETPIAKGRLKLKNVPLNPKLHGNIAAEVNTQTKTKQSISPMNNRDVFASSQSMSTISGLNIPIGLSGTSMTVSTTKVTKPSPSAGSSLAINTVPINYELNPKLKKQTAPRKRIVETAVKTSDSRASIQSHQTKKPRKPRVSSAPAIRQQCIKLNAKHGNLLSPAERLQQYQNQLESAGVLPSLTPYRGTPAIHLSTEIPHKMKNNVKSATSTISSSSSTNQNFSQLGSGITVTEVQDKNIRAAGLSPQIFNNSGFNSSVTGNSSSRNSTPTSFSKSGSSPTNITLPSSITITSPFVPIKATGQQEARGNSSSRKLPSSVSTSTTALSSTYVKPPKPQHITPFDVSALLAHSTLSSNPSSKSSNKSFLGQNQKS